MNYQHRAGNCILGFFAGMSLAAGWGLLSPAVGLARDIYVDNVGGDDRFDGSGEYSIGQFRGPIRSLEKALKVARGGDRVVLKNSGVPYQEALSLGGANHSGNSRRPFVIEGNGAILDGRSKIPTAAWERLSGNIHSFSPNQKGPQLLYLDDAPAQRQKLLTEKEILAGLEPLHWCYLNGRIYFRFEPEKLIQDYELFVTGKQVGITLYRVHKVEINNLIVQGFHLDGVNAADGVKECRLGKITARGNGRSGLFAGGTSKIELHDCTLGDNGRAQLMTVDFAEVRLADTKILTAMAPDIESKGGKILVADDSSPSDSQAKP